MTQTSRNGIPVHSGGRKTFDVMTSTLILGTLGSVSALLEATFIEEIVIGTTDSGIFD